MATSTIFLRQPSGVAIETADFADEQDALQLLSEPVDFISVNRKRDGAVLIIPVDNIASIEVR